MYVLANYKETRENAFSISIKSDGFSVTSPR